MRDLGCFHTINIQWCSSPLYVSIAAEKNINHYNIKYKNFLEKWTGPKIHSEENLYNRKYNCGINKSDVRSWIEFMNSKRGFDIRHYVPELNKF